MFKYIIYQPIRNALGESVARGVILLSKIIAAGCIAGRICVTSTTQ